MTTTQRKQLAYWSAQLIGWGSWVCVIMLYNYFNGTFSVGLVKALFMILLIGVAVSHLLRWYIRQREWLELPLDKVLVRLLASSVILGGLSFSLHAFINDVFFVDQKAMLSADSREVFTLVQNWTILFVLWSFGYFAYHWFVAHRREELRNLRLESAMRESELSMLRNQMNPHFIFNAMNSIRALIDEDPATAKLAITQLSGILRSSLLTGRKKSVPLSEELAVVRDYLALERIRFEERLNVVWNIDPATEQLNVPPMMLQTLAENAVKHGIAKLTKGGTLRISAERGEGIVLLTVANSGVLDHPVHNGNSTGIGLRNTRKRLQLLYDNEAELTISDKDGMVTTQVSIPVKEN
ncbi:MAG: histidine kinase [Flavobacteriales bacterium]